MAANGFAVDMEVLQEITREMEESMEDFSQLMSQANESMQVLNTQWKGPANSIFRRSFALDYFATRMDILRIKNQIRNISTAKKQYQSCEDEVLAAVNSLQI